MNVPDTSKLGHRSTVIGLMLSLYFFSLMSGSKFPVESAAMSSDKQFAFCYQLKLKRIR